MFDYEIISLIRKNQLTNFKLTEVKKKDMVLPRNTSTLSGHRGGVWSLAVLPSGQLASGSDDKTIKVWDITSGECIRTLSGHSERVLSLAVLPNGQLASGSSGRTIKVWDIASGACMQTLCGHSRDVYSLAVLPNGQLA